MLPSHSEIFKLIVDEYRVHCEEGLDVSTCGVQSFGQLRGVCPHITTMAVM